MGALAGDSPCLAPWRWHRAHLHREEAGLDIPCHGSQPEGSLGHRHHLCLRLGERKTKESPALSSSTYTKHGERENGRINDHSSGSLLHTHMQGVPTLGCLGCSEKQSMCCSIIPGTGRWARRCWSRPGPQSTAQPFSKAPTLSPLFYKQRQQHSPGCGISPAPALPWGWSPARLASDSASAPSLGSCICISYTAAAFAIRDSRGCSPGAAAGTTEKQRNK